ncbi:type I restriction endonuclease subunit R [Desulforhopalus sp. IMCC35007]|uniref:type I restriction endonuclease subunit R n=1 Tax=Desulforhopalus sp. IMCC35007 TaxID=2569543 RepID=UPI0010AEA453|nr:type I restriction endonuclease subunit R [Desulforhopalus sp. IMCC35007]TKB06079.1 type I restriction endonuclease subunit R [Desulforhopalus sp. IMCC35007]
MSTQSEAKLEQELISQLADQGYENIPINDEVSLLSNLKGQLEKFNNTSFSDKEFAAILNHLAKGNVFQKSKTLRDYYQLTKDNGDGTYVRFFNGEDTAKNLYQVTNQVTVQGVYKNRYDVTLLINGIPLVQVELKRRGLELKEAFNQINRYQRHSFWVNTGLFQYVQIFVISNGVNTKYYANNRRQSFKQTFYWADTLNRNITGLKDFTSSFLTTTHLGRMIANYVVANETHKILMVLRPYQYYATEAIIDSVTKNRGDGYIWHTTGSGKTLTSFKASQIIMDMAGVRKVVFVVDRKDLDYQTMKEFNSFKKDSVDVTNNTRSLVKQFADDTKLIVTTIQKLNNAITKARYTKSMNHLKDAKMVFIFDECHRSQFGATHQKITGFFTNLQLFGFTGTPIFADNAQKNEMGKRTTKDLFGRCLHKYVITDAIRDQNVLRFSVEYLGRYKKTGNTEIDIDVEAIDTGEVLDAPERLEKIVDYIIQRHDQKTHSRAYSAIFAVSSIANLITYYDLFKKQIENNKSELRIATIFTYGGNEEDADADGSLPADDYAIHIAAEPEALYKSSHSRDKLEEFIGDYNTMYNTSFSTRDSQQFENYFKDISKRLKEREKEGYPEKDRLDILLVVGMFLTGFDAKKVNTLYVDKSLKHHGLIQAFSRTNRILNEQKSHGNILCFRNLKKATDEAIALFSNKEAKEEILLPPYEDIVRKFCEAFGKLLVIVPTVKSVDDLKSEEDELAFIQAFRELMRIRNILTSFTDFTWSDLPMTEQAFEDYKSKYLDLYDKAKGDHQKEKESILNDVDFELELIHRDEINVAYILKLLAKLKQAQAKDWSKQRKAIVDLLAGEVELRSKRELIEKFIDEHLPKVDDADDIPDEFEKFWQEEKVLALGKICEEENLDRKQFQALIDSYIYSEQEPLRDDIFKCLDNRPSVLQAKIIGKRILEKMKEFVQVFVEQMVA